MKNYSRSIKLISLLLLSALMAASIFLSRASSAQQAPIDFNRDIRPILSDKCWACHGPDAPAKKLRLRLDSETAALMDLGQGSKAIVPNHPEQSEMIRRINSTDQYEQMPPPTSGRKLSDREKELLTEWIKQGAKWQQHWSFVTPTRPALPEVKNQAWVRNGIDNFILARLEKEGLQPSPEADRATLLRRVSLDVTGLPPTIKEIEFFKNDASDNAYEKAVDKLLASPRFGERMAYRWLDAARYADTNGYQVDGNREAWRWRDWVIEAFNSNKPYDEFTIEQLAGDLLPNATLDQKIATAFNRNHRMNAEGGLVPEEYRNEYVVDRVDTTSTVFLGVTLGCARCHNHKYDPFTQKEFYQFGAYFNSIPEDGHSFDQGNSPPIIQAPTRPQQKQLQRLRDEVKVQETAVKLLMDVAQPSQQAWEKTLASSSIKHWFPEDQLIVRHSLDENSVPIFNKSERAYHETFDKKKDEPEPVFPVEWKNGLPVFVKSPLGQGVNFDGKLFFDAGIHADFRYKNTSSDYKERFTISTWVYPESEQSGSIVTKVSDAPAEKENGVPRAEGYGIYFLNGKINFNLVFRWGEDAFRIETENKLPLKQWYHVAVTFDGLAQNEDRVNIYVNGEKQPLNFIQRSFFLSLWGKNNTLKIGAGGGPDFRFKGALDEVRMYSRKLTETEIRTLACADSLGEIAVIPESRRTNTQKEKLRQAYLALAASEDLQKEFQKLTEKKQELQKFEDGLPTLMVMQELSEPRPAFLLKRGAYDAIGEQVFRTVPAALQSAQQLTSAPSNQTPTRLDLARWIVSEANPLAARVAVNRFWQMIFGTGIVKTSEDFGSQGELPSHPELLDWLAVTFREGSSQLEVRSSQKSGSRFADSSKEKTANHELPTANWSAKALLRLIVTSATYRQSSKLTSELLQRDPENRLLARGARYRLSAEMIRDQALFASGLLVEKLGGSSVKPYQPDGLYKDMAFGGMTGYEQAKDDGLWRRSLYTYWKRTILSPTMQAFDASAREFCTVRDTRTNTPLQSLNLMNDVTYIEAARMLAERSLKQNGNINSQLNYAFYTVTSRQPNEPELALLVSSFNKQRDYFKANPKEISKFLAVGEKRNSSNLNQLELAAMASTVSLIFNLDEVITKQ